MYIEKIKREFEEKIGWACEAKLVATQAELEWEDADIDVQELWDWIEGKLMFNDRYWELQRWLEDKHPKIIESYLNGE